MQRNGIAYLLLAAVTLVLVLLGIFVFQLDNLDERFILQSRQLRALGEANDRIVSRLDRLSQQIESGDLQVSAGAGTGTGRDPRDAYAHVELLHPEVENFLSEEPFVYPSPDATLDGTLARGWGSGDPKTLNPLLSNAADVSDGLLAYVYSGLARRMAWTDPSRFTGDLAWRVEVTDDFKEFTFYLREGVRWHTPYGVDLDDPRYEWLKARRELTAHDFVFGLDMMMNPQVENGFQKSYYQELESWEAKGDYIFVVRWKKKLYNNISSTLALIPLPRFLFGADEDGNPLPEETLGLTFNQHWYASKGIVGTGPYVMTRYDPGEQIRLTRNQDYFGDLPAIREIVYPIYTDAKKTLLLLKSREVDVAGLRPGDYREQILRWQDVPESERPEDNPFLNGQIQCKKVDGFGYHYIGWNANKPIFADARVRRAMSLALNRDEIIDKVFVGLGSPARGHLLPSSPYNDPSIEPLPFDLEAAAELLAEAGWQDSNDDGVLDRDLGDGNRTPFEIRFLLYNGSPEWTSLANIYKEDLRKIGVQVVVEPVEWSLMQKRMEEKEFDLYSGGWALGWEADPYQLWHSSQADIPRGSNIVGFRNAEADEIIERLRETFDEDERVRLHQRLHNIIWDAQPYTFFRVSQTPFCWWDDVKGVVFAKVRPVTSSLPWWVQRQPG